MQCLPIQGKHTHTLLNCPRSNQLMWPCSLCCVCRTAGNGNTAQCARSVWNHVRDSWHWAQIKIKLLTVWFCIISWAWWTICPSQHGDTASLAVVAPFRTTLAVTAKPRRAASAVAAWDTSAKRVHSKIHTGPAGELRKESSDSCFSCFFFSLVWFVLIVWSLFHRSRHPATGKKGGRGVSQRLVAKSKAKRKSGAARRAKKMAAAQSVWGQCLCNE